MTMSAFGSRQMHYEYYFFGDPVRMGMAYFDGFEKESYKAQVDEFLKSIPGVKPTLVRGS